MGLPLERFYKGHQLPGPIGENCKKCGADHWHYQEWKNGAPGRRCGKCVSAERQRFKSRNRDKYRNWSWKQRGIDMDDVRYQQMLAAQAGKCAACGIKPTHKLVVDHCHDTGATRGLLCRRCNVLAQSPKVLHEILAYMAKYASGVAA